MHDVLTPLAHDQQISDQIPEGLVLVRRRSASHFFSNRPEDLYIPFKSLALPKQVWRFRKNPFKTFSCKTLTCSVSLHAIWTTRVSAHASGHGVSYHPHLTCIDWPGIDTMAAQQIYDGQKEVSTSSVTKWVYQVQSPWYSYSWIDLSCRYRSIPTREGSDRQVLTPEESTDDDDVLVLLPSPTGTSIYAESIPASRDISRRPIGRDDTGRVPEGRFYHFEPVEHGGTSRGKADPSSATSTVKTHPNCSSSTYGRDQPGSVQPSSTMD